MEMEMASSMMRHKKGKKAGMTDSYQLKEEAQRQQSKVQRWKAETMVSEAVQ